MIKNALDLYREVLARDNFCLIVLDSARADFFKDVLYMFKPLEGACKLAYEEAWIDWCNTTTWFNTVFSDGPYDLVYVSGNPIVYKFAPGKFKRFIHAFKECWVDKLRTVVPLCICKKAILHLYPRMVIHFLQPHYPYLGLRLPEEVVKIGLDAERALSAAVRAGVSADEIKKAYGAALRWAIAHIVALIERLPHKLIVVTSDHGELFGEEGRWAHPSMPNTDVKHPALHVIPWLAINREEGKK